MAFNPDAYLKQKESGFNPDAYLESKGAPTKGGSGQAALEAYGNTATLGNLAQLQAGAPQLAAGAAKMLMPALPLEAMGKIKETIENPNAGLDADLRAQGFKIQNAPEQSYVEKRDENIARMAQEEADFPTATKIGQGAGLAASFLVPGGQVAESGNILTKGIPMAERMAILGRAGKTGAKMGSVMGALSNPGDVEGEMGPQLGERLNRGLIGGGAGALGGVAAETLGPVAGWVAEQTGNAAAKAATRTLGRATPTVAAKMAKSGEDVALGRTLLDEGAIPILGTSARVAKRVDKLRDKSWSNVERLLKSGGDNAVVDGADAGMRILNSEEYALLKEAGETSSVKALEQAAEELANMGKVGLEKAQKIKKTIDERINYNKANPDRGGAAQEGRFSKRTALRDQMDESATQLGAGQGELKGALKAQGRLEKAADIADREAGRTQNNSKVSLTDVLAGIGGSNLGDSTPEKAGYSLLAAALNKGRRGVGNAVAARGLNATAKTIALTPALAAYAQRNPLAYQALVNSISTPNSGRQDSPMLNDPAILGHFQANPALLDAIQDPKLRQQIEKRIKRAPAKK